MQREVCKVSKPFIVASGKHSGGPRAKHFPGRSLFLFCILFILLCVVVVVVVVPSNNHLRGRKLRLLVQVVTKIQNNDDSSDKKVSHVGWKLLEASFSAFSLHPYLTTSTCTDGTTHYSPLGRQEALRTSHARTSGIVQYRAVQVPTGISFTVSSSTVRFSF